MADGKIPAKLNMYLYSSWIAKVWSPTLLIFGSYINTMISFQEKNKKNYHCANYSSKGINNFCLGCENPHGFWRWNLKRNRETLIETARNRPVRRNRTAILPGTSQSINNGRPEKRVLPMKENIFIKATQINVFQRRIKLNSVLRKFCSPSFPTPEMMSKQ